MHFVVDNGTRFRATRIPFHLCVTPHTQPASDPASAVQHVSGLFPCATVAIQRVAALHSPLSPRLSAQIIEAT